MRKICLILCLALLLTGCARPGGEAPAETAAPAGQPAGQPAETPAPAPAPETPAPAVFTAADSAAMSAHMSRNRWLIDGKELYGLDFDEALQPVLSAWRLKNGVPRFERVLCADCVPEYLALADGALYFVDRGSVQRLTLKTRERETLLEGGVRSLQLYEGALYYTDGEGRFCRAGLDGKNGETLIDAACGCAWAMPEGILYQSEDEGCFLRLRGWDGGDRQLTAAASYAPLRVGDTVWYSQKDREGSVLASVELTDGTVTRFETPELRGAAELLPVEGGWALRVFLAGDLWRQMLLAPGETAGEACGYSGYRLCDAVSETRRIDAAYDPDGRLRWFVFVDENGAETRFFGGEVIR